MSGLFTPIANRDAWATVRGFVYQLDNTLLRWLALRSNQVLELECGEDIDIISTGLATQQPVRELEQVKHREDSFTLNQEWVLDMLVTFFQHLTNNPQQELLFRYVTNADPTTERPALFADKTSGVAAWMELVTRSELTSADSRVEALRQHLQRRIQARVAAGPAAELAPWLAFGACVADRVELLRFIRRVEWSTGQGSHEALSQAVKDQLLRASLAPDADSADLLYARLFLYVAKRLSQPATKQLTPAELQTQAQLPLSAADKQALLLIKQLLGQVEERLGTLEAAKTQTASQLTQLTSDVDLLRQANTVFDYRLATPTSVPPPLVRQGTLRATKVNDLRQRLRTGQWVHLCGTQGSGKSQLAALVANQQPEVYWLDLRDYQDSTEKVVLLLQALQRLVAGPPAPAHPLLVLDDVPQLEAGSALEGLLIQVAEGLRPQGGQLLTTSPFPLPASLSQRLGSGATYEYGRLEFTDEEIAECLAHQGLRAQATEMVEFIALLTRRSPTLVVDLLRYWQAPAPGTGGQQWLDGLFNGKFSAATLAAAQRTISKTIADPAARQLLYRLSGISWGFSFEQVQAVSAVSATINAPYEAFQHLLDRWIRPVGNVYYVSPLLQQLGERNLHAQEAQGVQVALAQSLLATRPLDLLAVMRSFTAFCKGEEYTSAGTLLLSVFHATQTADQARLLRQGSLLLMWTQEDIPPVVPLPLRAFIRHEQLRLHRLLEADPAAYHQWLQQYTTEAEASLADRVLTTALWLVNCEAEQVPATFGAAFTFIIRHRHALLDVAEQQVSVASLTALFWLPIRSLQTAADVTAWLALAGLLREEVGLLVWEEEIAQTAVTLVSRQLAASATAVNAGSVLPVLETLATYFADQQQLRLQAAVLAVSIPLHFHASGDRPRTTMQLAALAAALADPIAQFLIYAALGKFLFTPGAPVDSEEWLIKAVDVQCVQQDDFVEVLVYAAAAVSPRDSTRALRYSQQAVRLATGNELMSTLEYVQVLAEEALAYWLHDDLPQSLHCFEEVVNQLFAAQAPEPTPHWMRLYVLLRHTLGYAAPAAAGDRVPERVADGSEYVKPYQGFFSFNTKDFSDFYSAQPAPYLLFYHLAVFAEGVGDATRAAKWVRRAFDAAKQAGNDQERLSIATMGNPYLLVDGYFAEALEASLLSAAMSAYVTQRGGARKAIMDSLHLADLNAQKPGSLWSQAEETSITYAVLPMLALALVAQATDPVRGTQLPSACQQVLENHLPQAADQAMWADVCALSRQVLAPETTSQSLLAQAEAHKRAGRQPLQVMCLLGAITHLSDYHLQLRHLLAVLQYLTTAYELKPALSKFILVPFTKWISKAVIRRCYVGNHTELAALLASLEAIPLTAPRAAQQVVRLAVEVAELNLSADLSQWIYA